MNLTARQGQGGWLSGADPGAFRNSLGWELANDFVEVCCCCFELFRKFLVCSWSCLKFLELLLLSLLLVFVMGLAGVVYRCCCCCDRYYWCWCCCWWCCCCCCCCCCCGSCSSYCYCLVVLRLLLWPVFFLLLFVFVVLAVVIGVQMVTLVCRLDRSCWFFVSLCWV